jgi:membrane-associated HD superfamily phosphohydrolase
MNRNEFKANAKKSIDDFFAKIEELEAKKDKVNVETKAKYERHLSALKASQEDLIVKFKNLSEASDEKWEETKEAFSSASESFKEGFGKIKALF